MRTYFIQTLGCKVNQYETDQLGALLRGLGLAPGDENSADLRIVNTCSVTSHAAKDSRQWSRKLGRGGAGRVIVTGCWATSDQKAASQITGVDAVLTHHDNVAERLAELIQSWKSPSPNAPVAKDLSNRPGEHETVKKNLPATVTFNKPLSLPAENRTNIGTTALPLLCERQSEHQRAFLKVQDGCDAHCTYCIIPQLRPTLWSKSVDESVHEAQNLIDSGHQELVLTGIFLGAYGQPTALRRRQPEATARPLGKLIDALCTQVRGLRRLRLSSLEPGDLTDDLIDTLRSHPQVVPHFHLPLQSGSDAILRKMNRQYGRESFLRMVDRVNECFDRPALTTDIIVGFPGETDDEFERTLEVVDHAKFIHNHAFSFSPRQNTAAARWTKDFVRGPVVNERIAILNDRARQFSYAYRRQFIGETVEVLVERFDDSAGTIRHGRCERYFDVHFDGKEFSAGDAVKLRVDRVSESRTFGVPIRRRLAVL